MRVSLVVREEPIWYPEFCQRVVVDGKQSQNECAIGLRGHPLKIEVYERTVRVDVLCSSSIPKLRRQF